MNVRRSGWVLLVVAAALAIGAAPGGAQDVIISEVAAWNEKVLTDEDGDNSDWIELHNPGSEPVSLAGWILTDNPENLTKWVFPDATVPAGGFLVVFASEKDRAVAGSELHTNFKLATEGEYLALIRPGGTVASSFEPGYPPQVQDVTYGVALDAVTTQLIGPASQVQAFVPSDDSLGRTWTETGFDASAWLTGEPGVGFDKKRTPTYADLIKTSLETPMYRVNTSCYLRFPFNVTDPGAIDALVLRLKYEDGCVVYLNGRELLRRQAPTSITWNSRASAARQEALAVQFETFSLNAGLPHVVQGANVLAIHGLNDVSTSPDFLMYAELTAFDVKGVQGDTRQYFSEPSPGLPSAGGLPGVADPPELSRPEGTFAESFSLTLTASSPTAAIRYTLDRSVPTEGSKLYDGPIAIAASTMVRAKVFDPGLVPSPTVTRTYLAVNPLIQTASSNLPLLVIDTFGKAIPEDPKALAAMCLIEPGADGRSSILGAPSLLARIGIKKRGSSSLGFPKNNYGLEVWGEAEEQDEQISIFGLSAESDWTLHGPYSDKTQMRNYLSYDWSNKIGRWAVRSVFVELYLNQTTGKIGSSQYWGVYVFMEKIKRGKDRVDIQEIYRSKTEEPDITGGYIFKKDRLDPGDTGLATARGTQLAWVYPKEKEATAAQKVYIRKFLDEYEAALNGTAFKDPEKGYAKHIDVDSFIDHHILVELTKNIDGYRLSTFMYKDRGGKLNMGPIWDYNLSLGNADYLNGWLPDGWYYVQLSDSDYPWYRRLFQDTGFVQRYRERWIMHRGTAFQAQKLLTQIDDVARYLDEAQQRNFKKWPTLGTYVWPNKFIGKTYQEEINFMKGWLEDRLVWIDSTFVVGPTFSKLGGQIDPGFALTITAPDGKIYYTLNGPDPLQLDGSLAPEAKVYDVPIVLEVNTRVRARTQVGTLWSGLKAATFVVEPPPVVITELMYNPPLPPDGSPYRATDFEFIEFQNVGTKPYDLAGVHFTKGVVFDFATSAVPRLGPGDHAVIVRNQAAFATRYEVSGITVLGQYTGDLSDRSEPVVFLGAIDEPIHDFTYTDTWHPATDGKGYSLVVADPAGPRDAWRRADGWRPSSEVNGSPGRADPPPPSGGRQVPGDLSQDGKLNITDPILVLRFLFQGSDAAPPCDGVTLAEGGNRVLVDFDSSGDVNLTDAIGALSYLFLNGAPPALGTECTRIEGCPDACTP
ncbi:MAG: CotH kinase family protein [Planctomycetes bacterium]|nr:CotH kinase family protein [Planctomycetota bacterium]